MRIWIIRGRSSQLLATLSYETTEIKEVCLPLGNSWLTLFPCTVNTMPEWGPLSSNPVEPHPSLAHISPFYPTASTQSTFISVFFFHVMHKQVKMSLIQKPNVQNRKELAQTGPLGPVPSPGPPPLPPGYLRELPPSLGTKAGLPSVHHLALSTAVG